MYDCCSQLAYYYIKLKMKDIKFKVFLRGHQKTSVSNPFCKNNGRRKVPVAIIEGYPNFSAYYGPCYYKLSKNIVICYCQLYFNWYPKGRWFDTQTSRSYFSVGSLWEWVCNSKGHFLPKFAEEGKGQNSTEIQIQANTSYSSACGLQNDGELFHQQFNFHIKNIQLN